MEEEYLNIYGYRLVIRFAHGAASSFSSFKSYAEAISRLKRGQRMQMELVCIQLYPELPTEFERQKVTLSMKEIYPLDMRTWRAFRHRVFEHYKKIAI